MRCVVMLLLSALALPALVLAAEPVPDKATCSCGRAFDTMARTVETDYAGFQIKVDTERREAYDRFKTLLRGDAAMATAERCKRVLDLYVEFFQDPHLFVLSAGKASGSVARASRAWTEAQARAEINRRRETLDPVEGLWRSRQHRFVVLHQAGQPTGTFVAVALAAGGVASTEIAAELQREASGNYRIRYRDDKGLWQTAEASLHRGGALLVFLTEAWAHVLPAVDGARLDPEDPVAPVFASLDPQTLYLSMPSFDPEYAQAVKDIVAARSSELEKAHGFIIDLRGNGGGSWIFLPLSRFLFTGPIRIAEDSSILASKNNLENLRLMRESMGERGAIYDPVLQRMRDSPGQLVLFQEGEIYTPTAEEIAPGPNRVVLLVDKGVGSAAESIVLLGRQSPRVIVVGENTRGNIDYTSVSLGQLGCDAQTFYLGMPQYTRNRSLPAGGLDVIGITPDVPVPAGLVDPLEFSMRLLAQ